MIPSYSADLIVGDDMNFALAGRYVAIGAVAGSMVTGIASVHAENAHVKTPGSASPGMTIEVDPSTGRILPGTPQTLPPLSPAEQNAVSTSSEGLQELPVVGAAGGTKVNLQGRFQSPLMATVGPDGKVVVEHIENGSHTHKQ